LKELALYGERIGIVNGRTEDGKIATYLITKPIFYYYFDEEHNEKNITSFSTKSEQNPYK
jgi:hypothetical protein